MREDVLMCFDGRRPEAAALMRAAGKARGVVPAKCPACSSSRVVHRGTIEPDMFCLDCRLVWGAPEPVGPPLAPSPPEDRGTPVWIWRDAQYAHSFHPTSLSVERFEVSVPIGWRLRSHPTWGVALQDVYGNQLTAAGVLQLAEASVCGFRLRLREDAK